LNAELYTESTGGKFAKGGGDDPKGDESANEEDEDNDGKTATDVLTGETGDSATRDSTAVTNDGRNGGVELAEALAGLEISGVEILRAMGQEVEPGHQQDGVDGEFPMVLQHLFYLVEKDAGL